MPAEVEESKVKPYANISSSSMRITDYMSNRTTRGTKVKGSALP